MKPLLHHIRVPAEQFAYIETDFEGTAEEAVALYRNITSLVRGGMGIESKDFNDFLDKYLAGEPLEYDPGIMEQMSVEQVAIIQAIKRSKARTK